MIIPIHENRIPKETASVEQGGGEHKVEDEESEVVDVVDAAPLESEGDRTDKAAEDAKVADGSVGERREGEGEGNGTDVKDGGENGNSMGDDGKEVGPASDEAPEGTEPKELPTAVVTEEAESEGSNGTVSTTG
jgi:hypothetical protein